MEKVQVLGLKELEAALRVFPVKFEKAVMRGAVRAGGNVFLKRAKSNVPVYSGDLQRSLRVSTSAKKGIATAKVTAGGARKKGGKSVYYAHMVEFGTGAFYTGTGGKSKKRPYVIKPKNKKGLTIVEDVRKSVMHPGIKPQPFMRPAFDGGTTEAIQAMADYIKMRITKELTKP